MSDPRKIVVVGAGLGGASAATALRERGYTGEVLLMGSDPRRPYELPPLSKGVLLGNTDEPDWVHEEEYYGEHDIRRAWKHGKVLEKPATGPKGDKRAL